MGVNMFELDNILQNKTHRLPYIPAKVTFTPEPSSGRNAMGGAYFTGLSIVISTVTPFSADLFFLPAQVAVVAIALINKRMLHNTPY